MKAQGRAQGIVLAATLLVALTTSGCQLVPAAAPSFPINVKEVIPASWAPLRMEEGDWDNDGASEWLLIYRYNAPYGRGPIGGVIYDAQADLQAEHGGLRLPSRPAFLIPYPLLPSSASGAGYLGEKSAEVRGYSTRQEAELDELAVLGRAYDDQLAFFSLFRWRDTKSGYQLIAHFRGDAGIELRGGKAPARGETLYQGAIDAVVVKTQAHDRSLLCRRQLYERGPDGAAFEQEGPATLDFAYGMPQHPAYPEGAVLAYYLALASGDTGTASTYLLNEEERVPFEAHDYWSDFPQEIHTPGPHPRILEIAYEGEVDVTPRLNGTVVSGGLAFESAQVSVAGIDDLDAWSRTWFVVNVASGQPQESSRWQLVGVYP